MSTLERNLRQIENIIQLKGQGKVNLIAVSKTRTTEEIRKLSNLGQRDFGENKVQELLSKVDELPKNIRWHLIGHLQRNKVKIVIPYVHLIHSVDSLKLLEEINREALKIQKVVDCLLQVFIATEETKYGLSSTELTEILNVLPQLNNVRICGLMGMASNSQDENKVRDEFRVLKGIFEEVKTRYPVIASNLTILSMGMSGDYEIAIEEGSNMIRVGSLLFGER